MLRFNVPWRDEIGGILIVLGLGILAFGALDLWLDEHGLTTVATAWMCIFISPLPIAMGLLLHLTRSRRRVDIEVPPPAPGQHQPPHRPSGPPR